MLVALRRFLFEFCYQIDLIESTGFFFAAFHTGRKVARNAVSRAIPTMIRIDVIPNTKIDGPSAETRLHLRRWAQIEVATSVCAGVSNMPPAYCDLIVRVSHSKNKSRESECSFGFYELV